jgi:hypothetical protein
VTKRGRWSFVVGLALLASACSSGRPKAQVAWQGPFGKRLAEQVYVFRPHGPVRSIVVFGHGWSDYTPAKFMPWFTHLVHNGNAIVYPRYQATDSLSELHSGTQVRRAWFRGLRTGFAHLRLRGVPVVAVGIRPEAHSCTTMRRARR